MKRLSEFCTLTPFPHRFARKVGLAFLGVVSLADLPDGEQTSHFMRGQILLEDAQGFRGELLFGFDDGTHDAKVAVWPNGGIISWQLSVVARG